MKEDEREYDFVVETVDGYMGLPDAEMCKKTTESVAFETGDGAFHTFVRENVIRVSQYTEVDDD